MTGQKQPIHSGVEDLPELSSHDEFVAIGITSRDDRLVTLSVVDAVLIQLVCEVILVAHCEVDLRQLLGNLGTKK